MHRHFKKGALIHGGAADCVGFILVVSGQLRVFTVSDEGRELTLYRLFDSLGGVSNHIRERRLARVHDILSRSEERQNIARIAEDHGFKTATHFSRAFRQQFGYAL